MHQAEAHYGRFRFIMLLLALWAAVITVRLFYFSIINRENAFVQMEDESLERKTVKAMRGRILSSDGKVLVQSRRKAKLVLSHKVQSHQLSALLGILEKELGIKRREAMIKIFRAGSGKDVVLRENLTLDDIKAFSASLGVNGFVFLKIEIIREKLVSDKLNKLGAIDRVDGQETGISGFEAKYDELLRGQDFIYEVMVDKSKKVILKTFNEVQQQVQGKDVFLTKGEWP